MNIELKTGTKQQTLKTDKQGVTILEVFQENGITQLHTPCGGNGTCKKCLVFVEGKGEVLACQTIAEDGMVITIPEEEKSVIAENGNCYLYPADGRYDLVAACDIGTTTVVCHLLDGKSGRRLATVSAPNAQRSFGADVISRIQAAEGDGLELLHGAIRDQISHMLEQLLEKAGRKGPVNVLAVAGNTVMSHLFADLSPKSIGVVPFTPLSLFGDMHTGASLGLELCEQVYIVPAIAGYVGGDITADLIAVKMHSAQLAAKYSGEAITADQTEEKIQSANVETEAASENVAEQQKESQSVNGKMNEPETLLLDIGTNGEMVLGKAGDYVCCATAAGPAFEGAEITMGMPAADGAISKVWMEGAKLCVSVIGGKEATGICGSGLIDALAVFLETGLMDETGLLADEDEVEEELVDYLDEDENGSCIWLTDTVKITQADIRKLQLAKASIAAGIRILLSEKGLQLSAVEQVILAGGFGSFLNKKSAAAIGLIPSELLDVTVSVGNAAGEGAISAALSGEAREELARLRKEMRYVELSTHKKFSDEYMEQMYFE